MNCSDFWKTDSDANCSSVGNVRITSRNSESLLGKGERGETSQIPKNTHFQWVQPHVEVFGDFPHPPFPPPPPEGWVERSVKNSTNTHFQWVSPHVWVFHDFPHTPLPSLGGGDQLKTRKTRRGGDGGWSDQLKPRKKNAFPVGFTT